MEADLVTVFALIFGPASAGGVAAWTAVKVGLNGARHDISEIKAYTKEIRSAQTKAAVERATMREKLSEHDRRLEVVEERS